MKTLIIAGGKIDKQQLKKQIQEHIGQNIIAVDRGLEELYKLKINPYHVVGDFDSVSTEILQYYQKNSEVVFHQYNPEKDYTDTDIAIQLAIKLKSSSITILGALGKRMDHAISNIHILKYALEAEIPCQILDEHNRIYLVKSTITLSKDNLYGKYVSLIPLTTKVQGLTLKGFKYPLENACLSIGLSLGVSNEIVEQMATIELKKGILMVIESRD